MGHILLYSSKLEIPIVSVKFRMQSNETVAIIGSGVVGQAWTILFARAGFNVNLFDIAEGQAQKALEHIRNDKVPLMERNGQLWDLPIETVNARIKVCLSIEETLNGVFFIQENVPEILEIKQNVFNTISLTLKALNVPEDSSIAPILSSSSSSMPASQISSQVTAFSSQCIVSHPVNPPTTIPLVEIVPSPLTSPLVVTRTMDLMKKIGQSPVLVKKEVKGFALNRLQYALLAEAFRLVEDGVCSPEDVDLVVSQGLGRRWVFMGPFQTIDMNAPGGVEDYCKRYQKAIMDIVRQQDNQRDWSDGLVSQIHLAMREKHGSVENMREQLEWRDETLMKLSKYL